jgi:hypothetical protein
MKTFNLSPSIGHTLPNDAMPDVQRTRASTDSPRDAPRSRREVPSALQGLSHFRGRATHAPLDSMAAAGVSLPPGQPNRAPRLMRLNARISEHSGDARPQTVHPGSCGPTPSAPAASAEPRRKNTGTGALSGLSCLAAPWKALGFGRKPKAEASVPAAPENLSDWTCIGRKPAGTAAGALYVDTHGQKWLVKGYGHDDQAKSEVLASHLLRAAGAPAADLKLVNLGQSHKGGLGVASRWMDDAQPFNARNPAHIKNMQQSFAAHAWLANWDSVGLTHDNVLIHNGQAVHIDPGGALEFRAMGGRKGDAFGNKVGELASMRDPNMNPASATVYGGMSPQDIASSAKPVLKLSSPAIRRLVERHGPGDPKQREALAAKLIKRQGDILAWCASAERPIRDTKPSLQGLAKKFPAKKIKPGDKHTPKIAGFLELGTPGQRIQVPILPRERARHDTQAYAAQSVAGMAKLTPAQREAVYSYAHLGYSSINASLRAGKPSDTAKHLDAAIRKAGGEIPAGTLLSRKIAVSGAAKEQLLNATGKILQEPAIMSTSTNPDMYTGNVHLKLTVGEGVKGLFVGWGSEPGNGSISRMPGESELVLPANTRLYVQKVTTAPSTRGRGDADGFGSESDLTHIVHAVILPAH